MTGSILVFTRSTPHHRPGGMEVQSWSLAAEWARMGQRVEVTTTHIPGIMQPFLDDGIMVTPLAGTKPGQYSRSWWQASREHWRSRPHPPGIVFSVSAGAYSVVLERDRFPDVPFVMQAHGTSAMELGSKVTSHRLPALATTPRNAKALLIDLSRYRKFDQIIAVGERVFASLASRPLVWSVPTGRICLIQNAVTAESYRFDPVARQRIRGEFGICEAAKTVVSIGRLHPQKRLDRIMQAIAVLRGRGLEHRYKLLLIGAGPDERRLRDLVVTLQIDEMVCFLGPVTRTAVRDFYSAADVSVLSTAWREGLPMAVLEALAAGLPCVVTAGSVAATALETGLRQVDTADRLALADALQEAVVENPDRSCRLPPEFLLAHCARSYLDEFATLATAIHG